MSSTATFLHLVTHTPPKQSGSNMLSPVKVSLASIKGEFVLSTICLPVDNRSALLHHTTCSVAQSPRYDLEVH